MSVEYIEIRLNGKTVKVPSARISGQTVVATGRWLRTAGVQDERFVEGGAADDPELFIDSLRLSGLKADIFQFAQHLPDIKPKYRYHLEWDNVAAIRIISFADWWNGRISDIRKDVRRAQKRGVIVRTAEFNDEFVHGILELYKESPVRQGRRFWHYRKDFETVRKEKAVL